jgi:hypothetical protein
VSSLLATSRRMRLMTSLEELFTSELGFGVTTATPMQRAILRAIQGVPLGDLATPEVLKAFGGVLPTKRPKEVCILSGIRGGKTLIADATAVFSTQHVRLDTGAGKSMRPGEVPRFSVVSRTTELAKKSFSYIKGALLSREALRDLLIGEPTSDSVTLRHPSGTPIEIKVVPASTAGSSLISDWSAGVIFDEAPRYASEEEGASINLEDMIRAVAGRLLDGALIMYIGSPWGQVGTVYNIVTQNEGIQDAPVMIVRATGPQMNPMNWTPERCEELRIRNPDAYLTDVLAQFRDPETALLSAASVDACSRAEPLVIEPAPEGVYTAVMDPAMRGNSWSLGIADTADNMRFRVCLTMQWTGSASAPLNSFDVLREMKPVLERYRIATLMTDQYSADALRDIGRELGINISIITITPVIKAQMYESMRTRFDAGMLEIPADPQLRSDLLGVKKILTSGGAKYRPAMTADGRHGDLAAMLALLCGQYLPVTSSAAPAVVDEPGEEVEAQPLEWWELDEERADLMQGEMW